MATYGELHDILTDNVAGAQALRQEVGIACLVAATTIIGGNDTASPPWSQEAGAHDKRIKWVKLLLTQYDDTNRQVFALVIADNATAPQSGILTATDAVIQSSVNKVIDALAADLL